MPPIPYHLRDVDEEKACRECEAVAGISAPAPAAPPRRLQLRRLFFVVLASLCVVSLTMTLLDADPSLLPSFVSDGGGSGGGGVTGHHRHRYGKDDGGPVNVILMISDGYGPASHTLARYFQQATVAGGNNKSDTPSRGNFASDAYLVGSHRSRSSSSLITDSAAGATAFSCGVKSYNGAIGVDSDGAACGTIFEAAKEKGYLTGLVVTSRLTDATPACFFAHASSRALESTIAAQMLEKPFEGGERTVDLAIGGGGCYFLPRSDPASCRTDERDLVTEATQQGWDVRVGEAGVFRSSASATGPHGEALWVSSDDPNKNASSVPAHSLSPLSSPRLPYLSLLTGSNTPYVVDLPADREGKDSFPTLAELSKQALSILTDNARRGREKRGKADSHRRHRRSGFMLMIEGSQIDLCQHQNDPGCMVREAVAFQTALASVIDHVDELNKRGEKTIVIATSDHETGGLDLGRQIGTDYPDYVYYPERLVAVQASAERLSRKLINFHREESNGGGVLREFITRHILGSDGGLGFGGSKGSGGKASDEEVDAVASCLESSSSSSPSTTTTEPAPIDNDDTCRQAIADILSRRARVGWSTPGHTGVDIPIYAHGYGAEGLHGNVENTDIARFVEDLLHLDLDAVTKRLRRAQN